MKKLVTLLLLGLLLPFAFASCGLGPADDTQLIFRISAPTNAHAELWNGASSYSEEICYNTIYGLSYPPGGEHTCTGANPVLRFSAPTNAHVQAHDFGVPYPIPVCFGDLVCDLVGPDAFGVPRPCSVFDPDAQCLGTVSDTTNAHVSSSCSGAGSYPYKVCCVSPAAMNNPPNAIIDTPVGNPSVTVGDSVDFTGTGVDSDGVVVAYSWSCVAGAVGVCPAAFPLNVEDPGNVVFGAIGTYTIEFNVQDDGGAWDPTPDTRTVTVIPNSPPDAIIDTPVGNPSITAWGSVDFTGTGVDSDGVVVAYSWSCVAGAVGVCPAAFPLNVEDPGNVAFSAVGTYTIEFNVQDDDLDWDPTPDSRTVTVLAPGSDPYMKITLFSAEPLGFSAGVALDFTRLDVRVKNYGGAVNNARIMVEVRDPTTNEPLAVPVSASVVIILASGGESTQDFESLDISALPPGAYKLAAEVYNEDAASPILQDSKAVFFTIGKPVPVPELDLLLLPLIAFSVLAALFLAGKRKA